MPLGIRPRRRSEMAKAQRNVFVCQNCGATSSRWAGKCASCNEWNTITEETDAGPAPGSGITKATRGRVVTLESLSGSTAEAPRFTTGSTELDRVTGGGIVPGSAMLIGGEPGIGKSTLLLQLAASLAKAGRRALYFSGEEAVAQVRLRAERLGCHVGTRRPRLGNQSRQHPGNLGRGQARRSHHHRFDPDAVGRRARCCARHRQPSACGDPIAHPLRQIAGQRGAACRSRHQGRSDRRPEGDRAHGRHRVVFRRRPRTPVPHSARRQEPLRRHGRDRRLRDGRRRPASRLPNPSELFLGDRDASSPGSAVFAGVEGTRPLLVEIQALVAPSALGTPRRAVVGWDSNRLSMLLAVLEARCGVSFASHDVYLNVAGGLKISRARGRSRRRRRPALVIFRCCATERPHLLRRDLAIGGRPRRFPHDNAIERGPQARLRGRRDTRRGGGRPRVRACRAHPDRSPQRTCGRVVLMPVNIDLRLMRLHLSQPPLGDLRTC